MSEFKGQINKACHVSIHKVREPGNETINYSQTSLHDVT